MQAPQQGNIQQAQGIYAVACSLLFSLLHKRERYTETVKNECEGERR
jgi:hypothetical protein